MARPYVTTCTLSTWPKPISKRSSSWRTAANRQRQSRHRYWIVRLRRSGVGGEGDRKSVPSNSLPGDPAIPRPCTPTETGLAVCSDWNPHYGLDESSRRHGHGTPPIPTVSSIESRRPRGAPYMSPEASEEHRGLERTQCGAMDLVRSRSTRCNGWRTKQSVRWVAQCDATRTSRSQLGWSVVQRKSGSGCPFAGTLALSAIGVSPWGGTLVRDRFGAGSHRLLADCPGQAVNEQAPV